MENKRIEELVNGTIYDATVSIERVKAFMELLSKRYDLESATAPEGIGQMVTDDWKMLVNIFSDIDDKLSDAIQKLDSIGQ